MMAEPTISLELSGLVGTYSQVDKLYGKIINPVFRQTSKSSFDDPKNNVDH